MGTNEVILIFEDQDQMIDFCRWFKNTGFDLYIRSDYNGKDSEPISCMEADEFPNYGQNSRLYSLF